MVGRFRWRRCAGARRWPRSQEDLATSRGRRARVPARGWRRRRSTVRGGMRGDGHELSILIRLGDGERQGRAPSNVSTMIIRPPQQGQRRAGETSSARLSASREGWGAFSAAASNCRARSMLSRSNRAGDEAVMSDAVEAARQHVQEKAADELVGVERHGLEPVAAFDAVVLTWGASGQGGDLFTRPPAHLVGSVSTFRSLSASVDISPLALGSENGERETRVKDAKHRRSRRARSARP